MQRTLAPEILDRLSPDDPAAAHARRDLRIVNRVLGNFAWFASELKTCLRPGERVLEIGAGTGELGLMLAEHGIAIDGLDRWPRPAAWPSPSRWHSTDLLSFEGYGDYAAVIGNLIFHQFTASELAGLGRRLSGARMILAAEPARRRLYQWVCAAAAPFVGASYVTRHDAFVSISGGFRGAELPAELGLETPAWRCRCRRTVMGAYRMTALRPDVS